MFKAMALVHAQDELRPFEDIACCFSDDAIRDQYVYLARG